VKPLRGQSVFAFAAPPSRPAPLSESVRCVVCEEVAKPIGGAGQFWCSECLVEFDPKEGRRPA
jgi:hypothetical protein